MHRVATLTYNGLCTFEFGIAVEVFGLPRPEFNFPWYQFQTVATEGQRSRATGGIIVEADGDLSSLQQADTIIIPGWRDPAEAPPAALLEALRAAHNRGARLLSICSGAFILAATGLLNGKRATTHWHHAEALQNAYPEISVEPDNLYIETGNIITSAGSAAGIDACLHMVRQDFGSHIANTVARRLVLPPHRDGGQAQYIPPAKPRTGQNMGSLMHWARQNLAKPLNMASFAAKAGMSERTFQRRFRQEVGVAPMSWLQRERLFHAQSLLESSPASLPEIARASGYPSLDTFRIAFKRGIGTSPSAYRKQFARSQAPADA